MSPAGQDHVREGRPGAVPEAPLRRSSFLFRLTRLLGFSEHRCPVCGSPMVLKRDRKKDVTWHLCTNETCKHRVEVENPAAEEAE